MNYIDEDVKKMIQVLAANWIKDTSEHRAVKRQMVKDALMTINWMTDEEAENNLALIESLPLPE